MAESPQPCDKSSGPNDSRTNDVIGQLSQKEAGAYYTPDGVVRSLLRWAVREQQDNLIDPACGDGRFIAGHLNSVGIERDPKAARLAMLRAPRAT